MIMTVIIEIVLIMMSFTSTIINAMLVKMMIVMLMKLVAMVNKNVT